MAEEKKAKSGGDPIAETQALVDKEGKGWTVDHAAAPQVISTATAAELLVKGGEYRAWKRSDTGTNLIEQTGDTPEDLAAKVADWEGSQFAPESEQPEPTDAQKANSDAATQHLAMTAGARTGQPESK